MEKNMSTKTDATFHQATHLLTLFGQKNVSKDQFGLLVNSGLLSDLLDCDPTKVDRDKFRQVLGLDSMSVDAVTSSIVTFNRIIRPSYPAWAKNAIYRELEATGPESYDIETLTQWLHDDQKIGVVVGHQILEHLSSNNMLNKCLGLRDLEEIQNKGIAFFKKYFQNKAVFGWKSVVQSWGGNLYVPFLLGTESKVTLHWGWLGDAWFSSGPVFRFV